MQRTKRVNNFLATAVAPRHRRGRISAGFEHLRDRQVPLHVKFLAFTLATCLTVLLMAFEVPLEGVLALAMPILGVPFDFVVDGMEVVTLPLLLTLAFMPTLVKMRTRRQI